MARDEHYDEPRSSNETNRLWWMEPKGEAHAAITAYVQGVERRQSSLFDKFMRLEAAYDPNSVRAEGRGRGANDSLGLVTENVIASNVDTVAAAIATVEVRARFMTDDADWSTQRTAKHLEWYAGNLAQLLGVHEKCARAFKSGTLKGTGLVHVFVDGCDEIRVEQAPVDEFVVDEDEAHAATPRQMHRRCSRDRDDLKVLFPGHDAEIDAAQAGRRGSWQLWNRYRPVQSNEVVVVWSWRLPVGVRGKRGYIPGREVVTLDCYTLYDEPYHKPFFPVARFAWSEPETGWYAIGGAERIAGHQRALNRRNWQIDRILQRNAVPTTYVRQSDANLAMRTTNDLGVIAVYNGDLPVTVEPPLVNKEVYASRQDLKVSAQAEFGQSSMATHAAKPAGIDSAVAMREYRDQSSQRFATQEKGFERLVLDVILLILEACKTLGKRAPTMQRRTRYGTRKIPWSRVDMRDVRVQIAAAATLPRTPAGRMQTVLEWAQAGVVSMDEARELLSHPDIDRALSVYTAAIEAVEHALEEILDGKTVMPEPYDNLRIAVWRGQMKYLQVRDDGAPEEVLEGIRQYVVQAASILAMQAGDTMPMGAPEAAQATAALAPEAMHLHAGVGG